MQGGFSLPHFYLADERYISSVWGLHPNKEEHETYIDLEPVRTSHMNNQWSPKLYHIYKCYSYWLPMVKAIFFHMQMSYEYALFIHYQYAMTISYQCSLTIHNQQDLTMCYQYALTICYQNTLNICYQYALTIRYLYVLQYYTGLRSAVGNVSGYRCVSDCRSRGRKFDPGPVPYFRGD